MEYEVSVREIVETILRSADIDNRFTSSRSRMNEGSEIHRYIQNNYTDQDIAEYYVKKEFIINDVELTVKGRIDGVLFRHNTIIIEEIKSTKKKIAYIKSAKEIHLAQLKFYGYLYMLEHKLSNIKLRLKYYSTEDKFHIDFDFEQTLDELEIYFMKITNEFVDYIKILQKHKDIRDVSIENMSFPFEYRTYQKEIISTVYKKIREKKNIYISAPTGTGKTLDTIYPAVLCIKDIYESKIFYLSAKSTQKQVALNAIRLLVENGVKIKAIIINAKEKRCKLDSPSCNPIDCVYAKNYYDKLKNTLIEIVENEDIIDDDVIDKYVQKYTMCPFELSLDVSMIADIIVCDYNYAFDPTAVLKRYFEPESGVSNHILLVDEAHNLVDRSRDMYTQILYKKDIETTLNKIRKNSRMHKALVHAIEYYEYIATQTTEVNPKKLLSFVDDELLSDLDSFTVYAEVFLSKNHTSAKGYSEVSDMYFKIKAFTNIYSIISDAHYIYYDRDTDSLNLFCSDARIYINARVNSIHSGVFFSATLTPLPYYRELLGGNSQDKILSVPSIFDEDNFKIKIDTGISTYYKTRHRYYKKIAIRIKETIDEYNGNFFVFFPSYEFMHKVYDEYINLYEDERVIVQKNRLSEREREEFLNLFTENSSICAFAVNGGVFSESVDLVGTRLSGTIICGVSLPMMNFERELIRKHFESQDKDGFAYSYVYPAMNKVLQSMGRVIRTEFDTGIAVLLDERFVQNAYFGCFPKHYSQIEVIGVENEQW